MSQNQIITAQPWQFDVSASFTQENFLYLFFRVRATKDLSSFGILKIDRNSPYTQFQFMIPKEIVGESDLEHTAQFTALNNKAAYYTFTRTIKPSPRPDSWRPEEVKISFNLISEKWNYDRKENRALENILPQGRLLSFPFDRKDGNISFHSSNKACQVPVGKIIKEKLGSEINVNTNFLFLPEHGPCTAFIFALARAKSTAKNTQGNYEVVIAADL